MSYCNSGKYLSMRRCFKSLAAILAVVTIATGLSACSITDLLGGASNQTEPSTLPEIQIIAPSFEATVAPTEPVEPAVYPYMEYANPLFADSSQRYLTADDLEQLSGIELLLARSEIYARHGVIFANADLAAYFANQSWYQPTVAEDAFDNATLNDQESANVQLIQLYENIAKGMYAPAADNPYMPYYDPSTELLLPKSSNTKLTAQDLAGLTAEQLIIIRNQIIARHGYTFGDRELMEYFLQCSWYRPSTAPGRTDLVKGMTSLEYENMDFLYQYEQNPQPATDPNTNSGSDNTLTNLDTSLTYGFENEIYSIKLPAFWKDYAVIKEWDNESGIPQVRFSEGPDNEKHGIGHLFTLKLQPVEDFYDYPQYKELGIISNGTNTYRFIILYPSDVQFSDENRALYSKMTGTSFVEQTLVLKNGYAFIN